MAVMTKKEILEDLHNGISADIIRNEINVLWYTKCLKKVKGKDNNAKERRDKFRARLEAFSDSEKVGEFYLEEIKKRLKEC